MNIEELKKKIDNKEANDKLIKKTQEEEYKKKITDLLEKVKELAPKISQLIEIANYCLEHNIDIGNKHDEHPLYESYINTYFYTDHCLHRVGFYKDYKKNVITTMGIACGGCCGNIDLIIDKNGKVLSFNEESLWSLERFVNTFDKFEEKFEKYIESLE